jgi:hypothetical protein
MYSRRRVVERASSRPGRRLAVISRVASHPVAPLVTALLLHPLLAAVYRTGLPLRDYTVTLPASLMLSYSFYVAVLLPRALSARLGRVGALLASSLLLGVVGMGIGVLSCDGLDPECRSSVGAWMLAWMLLSPAYALGRVTLVSAARVSFMLARAPYLVLARFRANLSRGR